MMGGNQMAITKITWSSLTQRKARLVLTILAIGLSVSLVVAVTSGYASAEAAVVRYFTEFMGSTDIKVSREPGLKSPSDMRRECA